MDLHTVQRSAPSRNRRRLHRLLLALAAATALGLAMCAHVSAAAQAATTYRLILYQ